MFPSPNTQAQLAILALRADMSVKATGCPVQLPEKENPTVLLLLKITGFVTGLEEHPADEVAVNETL